MILFGDRLKNSAAYKSVERDIISGNIAHAYMLVSPDGKATGSLIKLIAMRIFCKNGGCGLCPECKKVLSGNHSDIVYVNADEGKIGVETVNAMVEDTYILSNEGGYKLYFVLSAEQMNAAAQNKLLKTLEEPPENVIIFLAVKNAAAMYDTIKSRVRTVRLDVFSRQEIYDEIVKTASPEKAATAAACADGMLGKALDIATSETYSEVYDKAFWILLNITKSKDISSVLNDKVFSKDNFPVLLDVLSVIFGDVAEVAANPVCAESKQRGDAIKKLAAEFTPKAAAAVIFALNENRKMLNYNTSSVSVAENMLFKILEVKHLCR